MNIVEAFAVSAVFISLAFALGLWTGLRCRRDQVKAARESARDWRAAACHAATEAKANEAARNFLAQVFASCADDEDDERKNPAAVTAGLTPHRLK